MWEEKQLERERQREKLDNEYVKKLYYNRSVLRKGQVSAAYEANVVEQPVESNRFDSTTTGKNA